MKNIRSLSSCAMAFLLFVSIVPAAEAYTMKLAETSQIVDNPETATWYFGDLTGDPNTYRVTSDKFFRLEMRLLVPEESDGDARYGATVFWVDDAGEEPVAALTGGIEPWREITEKYSNEKFLAGPEFHKRMAPGSYDIKVGGNDNFGRYVLVLGAGGDTDTRQALDAVKMVPQIKESFFGKSPASFISSWFAKIYIVVALVAGYLLGLLWFTALKAMDYRQDRICLGSGAKKAVLRLILAVLLVVWAVSTTWNPTLIMLAGLLLFDSTRLACRITKRSRIK